MLVLDFIHVSFCSMGVGLGRTVCVSIQDGQARYVLTVSIQGNIRVSGTLVMRSSETCDRQERRDRYDAIKKHFEGVK
jgi:hypothetical protein